MLSFVLLLALGAAPDEPFTAWVAEKTTVKELPVTVGQRLSAAELKKLGSESPRPPFADPTDGVRAPNGALWLATNGGVAHRPAGAKGWRLFHSKRWLPSDKAEEIAVGEDGKVWVKTTEGSACLAPRRTTLAEKMDRIHAELRRHHVREGLIGSIHLNEPGTLARGWHQPDNDNDGLWTSLYVGAEAFRFAVTGDPKAKDNAWQSLQALMFLERVTGISGFAARSIVPSKQPKPDHGEWHKSADGKWWWKGDTSSDELDGHYFAYAVYFDLAATNAEKEQIRGLIGRMTDHILDHGYFYVGPSGGPTRWGVWAPEKLNRELDWIGDRGLNSLEILSHLKVAEHIVGKPRYAQAATELIDKHGYALNTVWQKHIWPPVNNHSDDELAFLAYYPLLVYERDPKLRAIYLASLERSWRIERPELSPFFNYVYGACRQAGRRDDPAKRPMAAGVTAADYDGPECLQWFRDVPEDLVDWTVTNSGRQDIGDVIRNRQGRSTGEKVLNVAERRIMRWNGDPYQLDGGSDGRSKDDGTFILLPYWMGRYHRFLE